MKKIYTAAVLLLASTALGAQSINQSVQVTNDYRSEFADFPKAAAPARQIDSLYSFDYSFDYSVFDSPYYGSYEFTPYEIQITPAPRGYDGGKFYLKAGAGYTLHPVLDLVWTPVQNEILAVGVYNFGRGYAGNYGSASVQSGASVAACSGYDMSDRFGVGGMYLLRKATMRFGAGYDGIFTGHSSVNSAYNGVFVNWSLAANESGRSYFDYSIGLDYRYGANCSTLASAEVNSHWLGVHGHVGPVMNNKTVALLLDFNFETEALSYRQPELSAVNGLAGITPHVAFSKGIFDFDAGAKVDFTSHSGTSGFSFAPAVEVAFRAFSGTQRIYAGATGGHSMNTVYSLRSAYHFFAPGEDMQWATREKLGLHAGIEGRLGERFQYDLKAGYKSMADMPVEYLASVRFADVNLIYAALGMQYKSRRLDINGDFRFTGVNLAEAVQAFAPSPLTADVRGTYNWLNRVFLGVNVRAAAGRTALDSGSDSVPGWVDLGLYGSYGLSSSFSIWAEAGNLLSMDIQEHPGYVLRGPWITAGISLKL